MADRRMFARSVINSARFLRMPVECRLLYYDLGMAADDDGVVEAFTVMRTTGVDEKALDTLIEKGFVEVLNDDLVAFITDWKTNNKIRKDRYHKGVYTELLKANGYEVGVEETKEKPKRNQRETKRKPDDNQMTTNQQPNDNQTTTEVRLGKDRLGKVSQGKVSTGEEKGILTDSCAEPQGDSTPPVITLPLISGEEYPIYQKDIDRWSEQFPAVDVMQSLRNIQAWDENNPTKRKTSRGIRRHITTWLMGDQDKGGNKGGGNKNGSNSSQPDTRSTQEDKYADWDFGLVL